MTDDLTLVTTETDLTLPDGRTVHVYDSGPADGPTVYWHHGTPNTGAPPAPLAAATARYGVRWVSHDRPGYGTSTAAPGRDVAAVAADAAAVADALGVGRFAVMGHSGGGTHALACAALLGDRVPATVSLSSLAPADAPQLDYEAGMHPGQAAELRAARQGRAALAAHLETAEWDDEIFTDADRTALGTDWAWVLTVVRAAQASGPAPMVDDNLAFVGPWGFDPADIDGPVLVGHGLADRMVPPGHGRWLADRCPDSELWLRPGEGHVSVLHVAEPALAWLVERAG